VPKSVALLRGWSPDGVSFLSVLIAVRFALPSQLVISSLGGAGSPAAILSLLGLGWWVLARLHRSHTKASSPVIAVALLFAGAATASYLMVCVRPATAEEFQLGTLSMLVLAGWLGLLFVAHDGTDEPDRLRVLMNRLAVVGGLLAALGLLQFLTGQAWVDRISIPGLTANQPIYGVSTREGFIRPVGTAVHPIEFGAVLCMLLPVTIGRGLGFFDLRRRGAVARWWPAIVVVSAISMSVTRSALVGMVVGVVALAPALTRRQRIVGGLFAGAVGVLTFLLVPGMTGSVLGLFTGISGDEGVSSRLDSFADTESFFLAAPWLGRGFGTFMPRYRIVDNQYLGLLLEMGLVGMAALLTLIVTTLVTAVRAWRRSSEKSLRGAALVAGVSVLVGAVSMVMFDGFAFPMMASLWFLMIGVTGAAYRLARSEWAPINSS
jgi:O-antigen ligase